MGKESESSLTALEMEVQEQLIKEIVDKRMKKHTRVQMWLAIAQLFIIIIYFLRTCEVEIYGNRLIEHLINIDGTLDRLDAILKSIL